MKSLIDELSPETLAPILSSVYDLGGPVTCKWLSSGLNAVFRVTASDEATILKVYRAGWRTQAEVLEEIGALWHLDRNGVRVTLPVAPRDGASVWQLTVGNRERQVVLFAHAQGEEIIFLDTPRCRLLGRTLAEIHNATDEYTQARVRYGLEDLLLAPMRHIVQSLEHRGNESSFVRSIARRLHKQVVKLGVGAFDWGYCHGDFRPSNLYLDETTGAVTVFDFELGGAGFRAYDLAYMRTNLHRMAVGPLWDGPPVQDAEQCWAAFLFGYSERRPLRGVDLDAIPLFVMLRAIHLMGFLLTTAREPGNDDYWRPSGPEGLPGGAVFERALRFLHEWDEAYSGGSSRQ